MKRFPLKTWDAAFRRALVVIPMVAALFGFVGYLAMPDVPQRLPNDDILYPEREPEPPWVTARAWGVLAAGALPVSLGSALWFVRVRREERQLQLADEETRRQAWRDERAREQAGPLVGFDAPILHSTHDPFEGDDQHAQT